MTRTFGVILAGGGGTRLGGVRKADIRIGGRRLIDRVAEVFRGQVDELLVASGRLDLTAPARLLADASDETLGPLAGMRAAAEITADEDIIIFAAVDTPFLPADYVQRLTSAASERGAAYATWNDAFYPTSSAWRRGTLMESIALHPADSGPKLLLQQAGARRVDWASHASTNPFSNLNSIIDLIALQRRAMLNGEKPGFRGL